MTELSHNGHGRRPIAVRNRRWPHALANAALQLGLSPNAVSLLSVAFALMAMLALIWSGRSDTNFRAILLLIAAGGIQLRLLCNMLDGLMAVEGGRATRTGVLFNEVPDRFADAMILIGAGYSSGLDEPMAILGWSAAVLALITAYVRVLGAAVGTGHDFRGPMAKPHRMALLTLACAATVLEAIVPEAKFAIPTALILIIVGSAFTIARRLVHMAGRLRSGP